MADGGRSGRSPGVGEASGDAWVRGRPADSLPRQPDVETVWQRFHAALAEVLADLGEDEYLVISSKRRQHYIQFAGEGRHGMRAEAASNAYIVAPADRLGDKQHERLAELGWDGPEEPRPGPRTAANRTTQGNFFLDVAAPVPFGHLAALTCATFVNVYGVRHPGELEYKAFHRSGEGIRFPTLRLQREATDQPAT